MPGKYKEYHLVMYEKLYTTVHDLVSLEVATRGMKLSKIS